VRVVFAVAIRCGLVCLLRRSQSSSLNYHESRPTPRRTPSKRPVSLLPIVSRDRAFSVSVSFKLNSFWKDRNPGEDILQTIKTLVCTVPYSDNVIRSRLHGSVHLQIPLRICIDETLVRCHHHHTSKFDQNCVFVD